MDLGVGDFVEYVGPFDDVALDTIAYNTIYQVVDLKARLNKCLRHGWNGEKCDQVAVELKEVPDHFFCSTIFRPIYRPKASIIEDLRQNIFKEEPLIAVD